MIKKGLNIKKILLASFAILILTACGEMKIDSSTNAIYQESIANMKNNLPVEKSQKFSEALANIFLVEAIKIKKVPVHKMKKFMLKDGAIASAKKLNGKTADEVIEKGEIAKTQIECFATDDMIEVIYENIDKMRVLEYIDTTEKIKEYEKTLQEKIDFYDKNCF